MPGKQDRLEVRKTVVGDRVSTIFLTLIGRTLQILQACSRKVALDASVRLDDLAAETRGYSGADLQALMYNAHLDAIHETLSNTAARESHEPSPEERDLAYTAFGGSIREDRQVLSRADQSVINKRVSSGAVSTSPRM